METLHLVAMRHLGWLVLCIAGCPLDPHARELAPAEGTTTASSSGGANAGGDGGEAANGGAGGSPPAPVTHYDCSPPAGAMPALALTTVQSGFSHPMLMRTVPGSDAMYVAERAGVIYRVVEGVSHTFLDISDLVALGSERGLLGLAFHPEYADNGRFFVHYNNVIGNTVIAGYRRFADQPNFADPSSAEILLTVFQPQANHNGGSIDFSPIDGMLYIALGDGGGVQGYERGQDLSSPLGKILRIDVSASPYAIPAGNMTGTAVLKEIWDYGVRNPFRTSFDVCTGDLYIGDVGAAAREEIDVEPAGVGQNNYGWSVMEGSECREAPCTPVGLMPAVDYTHVDGCSVIGGAVYRGAAIPALRGAYLYTDFCSGKLWSFRWQNSVVSDQLDLSAHIGRPGITAISQDNHGELYLVDYAVGSIFRIVNAEP